MGGLSASVVATTALTKRFGSRTAVDSIDIDLPAGVVAGFVGPNESGKTTTIQLLLGLIRPTSGTARVLGEPITNPVAYLGRVALIEVPSCYRHALVTLAVYAAVTVAATLALFRRRDA